MIYFARQGESGPIKIGHTDNVKNRFDSLQTASAEHLQLLAIIPGDRSREKSLHGLFENSRINGEWFAPTPELLGIIGAIAKYGIILDDGPVKKTSIFSRIAAAGLDQYLDNIEVEAIKEAFSRYKSHTEAAKALKISFRSFRHRVAKHKITLKN